MHSISIKLIIILHRNRETHFFATIGGKVALTIHQINDSDSNEYFMVHHLNKMQLLNQL